MTIQYQGVWSLQSAAQLQSTQRWVTDPLYKNTTLLLQADDAANAAQNNTFLDSSSNNFTITRNGNTTQGSFTPFSLQPGAWSAYMGSSGSTLSNIFLNGESDFAFGTGDFTIEMWMFLVPSGANQVIYDQRPGSTNGAYPSIYLNNSTAKLTYYVNTADRITQTSAFTYNTWHHVVVTRTGTSTKMFVDGIQEGSTYTDSTNYLNGANRPVTTNGFSNDSGVVGHISNLRVVKGSGPYQSAGSSITVPTAPLTPVTNTVLLTLQSNRFVDTNTQVAAKTINVSNNPSIQAFSPFAPQYQWTSSVIGGSAYFDGSTDSLTRDFTSTTDGMYLQGSTYTYEAWIYPTTASGLREIYVCNATNVGSFGYNALYLTGTNAGFATRSTTGGAEVFRTGGTVNANEWAHLAVVVSSNTAKLFLNGAQVGADLTVTANTFAPVGAGIGRYQNGFTTGVTDFTGYITNVRIVQGQALATGNFTPPTAPVTTTSIGWTGANVAASLTGTVSFLMRASNAGIFDGTMKNNLETVGNAQISTAVVKYGSGSMYFDGTSDYLRNVAVPVSFLRWWLGEYTVEYWLYANAFTQGGNTESVVIGLMNPTTTNNYWSFGPISNGTIKLYYFNGSGQSITTTQTIVTGQWYHLAMVQRQGIVYIYINGVLATSAAYSGTPQAAVDATNYLVLGSANNASFNGYLDDVRITLSARYTSNFIPPSVALPRQ